MSRIIGQELAATGVAQVIVVLKEAPAADIGARATRSGPMVEEPLGGIERHFRHSELSQDAALAASDRTVAPAVRYYPNLGVALGTVDRAGFAHCAPIRPSPRCRERPR